STLGINRASIEIGDRSVVEAFIKSELKIEVKSKILEMLRALDKVGRKSVNEVLNEYSDKIERESLERLIQFGGIKGSAEEVLNRLKELNLKSQVNLEKLIDSLNSRGVKNVLLNMGVVRGLDYYTGIVFEVFDRECVELGALAGGGRYDALPEVFGRADMGATGVAGGVERIILALKKVGGVGKINGAKVYVAYAKPDMIIHAGKITSMLRRNGIPTDMDISGRSLKRQMEVASSKSVKYVVLIAPREYSEGKVILRDMGSGEERVIKVDELIPYVK
ncbi:MAG: ATP phosphoribosyltransferase regulatory subunit, partial [Nitrososphaerales archaeon]